MLRSEEDTRNSETSPSGVSSRILVFSMSKMIDALLWSRIVDLPPIFLHNLVERRELMHMIIRSIIMIGMIVRWMVMIGRRRVVGMYDLSTDR